MVQALAVAAPPAVGVWSFEPIYDQYHTAITAYLFRLVGSHEQAEDLAQETFLKAFKNLPQMDASLRVNSWIYRIATNTAYDVLRRRKLIAFQPIDALVTDLPGALSDDPQERCGADERVLRALAAIKPHYRVALILSIQQGATYSEIAAAIDIVPSAVKMCLCRARAAFRAAYHQLGQEVA